MKLKEVLHKETVGNLDATDKKTALEQLAVLASKTEAQLNPALVLEVLQEREKLGSTGVGNGVAIPHGKVHGLKNIICIFGRSVKGIDFQSHDQKPAHLFFAVLAPENAVGNHLQTLARLSRLLKGEEIRQHLLEIPSDELYNYLIAEDEKI